MGGSLWGETQRGRGEVTSSTARTPIVPALGRIEQGPWGALCDVVVLQGPPRPVEESRTTAFVHPCLFPVTKRHPPLHAHSHGHP